MVSRGDSLERLIWTHFLSWSLSNWFHFIIRSFQDSRRGFYFKRIFNFLNLWFYSLGIPVGCHENGLAIKRAFGATLLRSFWTPFLRLSCWLYAHGTCCLYGMVRRWRGKTGEEDVGCYQAPRLRSRDD